MQPLSASSIRGNWATLLLPIRADESIDYDLLRNEIERLIAARVDGIYSNGSAGEFYTQTEDEFDRVNALLAEKCEPAGMPFQIGASHMSPQISLGRVARAKSLRPSAIQIILPDWFSPSWTEILDYLRRMVDVAMPIPLVIYNPPHAKRRPTPAELLEIAETIPGVVGLKVLGGDDDWYAAMQPVFSKLSVFIPGHRLATGLSRGARGAYSNVACLSPAGAQRWYELCLANLPQALEWEQRILAFWDRHVASLISEHKLSNMAVDKAAAAAGGWLPGFTQRLRWPYASATDEQVARIRTAYEREWRGIFAGDEGR